MCLILQRYHQKEKEKFIKGRYSIIVYKILNKNKLSPCQQADYTKEGMYHSDRQFLTLTKAERKDSSIDNGLHFYTTKEMALSKKFHFAPVLATFKVLAKDIIGVNNIDQELVANKGRLIKYIYIRDTG